MNAIEKIQDVLGVTVDGIWGPKTQAALDYLIGAYGKWNATTATSFADPADLESYHKCKNRGGTDHECFLVGDNGVGLWGDSTIAGTGPCCALPSASWHDFYSAARNKLVLVRVKGVEVVCQLRDTSGSRNVIDLNPDACLALGLTPPVQEPALWKWA